MQIAEYTNAVSAYLKGEWPIKPSPLSFLNPFQFSKASQLQATRKLILDDWSNLSLANKVAIIGAIEKAFHIAKQSSSSKAIARITKLKNSLTELPYTNWKETLLKLPLHIIHNLSYTELALEHTDKPLELTSSHFSSSTDKSNATNSYAIMGNTFFTNRQALSNNNSLATASSTTHVLDAIYSAYTHDKEGSADGVIIAIGDGCGGHAGDKVQDRTIAKTAHVATQHASRLLAAFSSADSLKIHLPFIVESTASAIVNHYPRNSKDEPVYQEGTTLACGRLFIEGENSRFIGLHIGDTLLAAWHPTTRYFKTLAPACTSISSSFTESLAIFPLSYQPEEIHMVDITLPTGSFIFAFSDGVYPYLPCSTHQNAYSNSHAYQEIHLDETALITLLASLPVNASAAQYAELLAQSALKEFEKKRQVLLKTSALAQAEVKNNQADYEEKIQQLKEQQQIEWHALAEKEKLFKTQLEEKKQASCQPLDELLKEEKQFYEDLIHSKEALKKTEKQNNQLYTRQLDHWRAQTLIQLGDDFSIAAIKAPSFFSTHANLTESKEIVDSNLDFKNQNNSYT